jgi:hypothetical protein
VATATKGITVALIAVAVATAAAITYGELRSSSGTSGADLRAYVSAVERVRLPVNQLLEGADPILSDYTTHRITPLVAWQRMDQLERQFASYSRDINAITPDDAGLAQLHAPYAHTYVLEDSYLSALTADLLGGSFDGLPATQNQQRQAIIEWRIRLEVLAQRTHTRLPDDIEQAGRGEIAPSPSGS